MPSLIFSFCLDKMMAAGSGNKELKPEPLALWRSFDFYEEEK